MSTPCVLILYIRSLGALHPNLILMGLPCIQCRDGASFSSDRGKGNCFPLPQVKLQQHQCGHLDLFHPMKWHKSKQPRTTLGCLGMGIGFSISAESWPTHHFFTVCPQAWPHLHFPCPKLPPTLPTHSHASLFWLAWACQVRLSLAT